MNPDVGPRPFAPACVIRPISVEHVRWRKHAFHSIAPGPASPSIDGDDSLARGSEKPTKLELIHGLGLDPDEALEVHAHAIEFDAPVRGREQLTIYLYGADVDRPDAPLLLFSHGGSVRPTPGLVGLGLPILVALARRAGIPLRFAALDHRGASSHEHKLDYCLADRVVDLEVAHEFVLAELGGHRRRLALMGTSIGGRDGLALARRRHALALVPGGLLRRGPLRPARAPFHSRAATTELVGPLARVQGRRGSS